MPTYIRVKDLPNAATSPAADDFVLLSGTANGARKISRSDFIAAIASQIVAAPSTYKIATLDGADKLTSSQDPSQSVSYLGGHDMVANSPALADGSGTAGDTYYVTNPGTRNYGSGNITAQEGDALVYSGSVWQLVEGIANILDGISTASTARTTLEVNSINEDAQANGTKVTAPALYFNGTSSVVTVADDDRFSFTDGTDDLPFSLSAWIKADDLSSEVPIVTKYGLGREFNFYVQDSDLALYVWDGTNSAHTRTASAITGYNGQWIHVAATYSGTSGGVFSAAADGINLFINGVAQTITAANNASYTGIANTSEALRLGARLGIFGSLHLRDAKIFNRELTSTEIAQLARGNDLGFSEEWGGANGGLDTSNFSAGVDGFTGNYGTLTAGTASEDGIGGEDDWLKLTLNTSSAIHQILSPQVMPVGARVRVEFDCYIPPTNSHVDGVKANLSSTITSEVIATHEGATTDTVFRVSGEGIATGNQRVYITALDGSSTTVSDSGGDDWIAIKNVKITQLGTLADFRAEDYNESASKLLDRSSNNFVGVGTSVTLTGNQRHISADTIDLKNLPTSSAGLSAGEVWSNGGVLTVV